MVTLREGTIESGEVKLTVLFNVVNSEFFNTCRVQGSKIFTYHLKYLLGLHKKQQKKLECIDRAELKLHRQKPFLLTLNKETTVFTLQNMFLAKYNLMGGISTGRKTNSGGVELTGLSEF